MDLKFGWKAGTEQFPPEELLKYAVIAEEAGFDSVDVSDHFHPWSERGQACFAWTWLGAAAVKTKSIMLGTGVSCPILRYHPAVIAQAAATVASLARGRTFLGVGTGEALNEYAATGLWPPYSTRRAQMIEAIELIRALWSGDVISHRGEHYRTCKAKLYTRPQEAIPLLISSMVPQSARMAGCYGDGLITVGGKEPAVYRELLKNFEDGAKQAGKDPSRMTRIVELGVDYTDDIEKAIEDRKNYWAGVFVPALFTEKIYTPKMSADNGAAVGADTIRKSVCISADPKAQVENARQYLELGFDHLIFHSAGANQEQFLSDYGQFVLPRLRRL